MIENRFYRDSVLARDMISFDKKSVLISGIGECIRRPSVDTLFDAIFRDKRYSTMEMKVTTIYVRQVDRVVRDARNIRIV